MIEIIILGVVVILAFVLLYWWVRRNKKEETPVIPDRITLNRKQRGMLLRAHKKKGNLNQPSLMSRRQKMVNRGENYANLSPDELAKYQREK